MMKKNSTLHMIVTLFVIAVAVASLMSYFNDLTGPIIEKNNAKALNESLAKIIPAESYQEGQFEDSTVYIAKNQNEEIGFLVITTANGYGGEIKILTGIDNNNKVIGVEILSLSETPGLGANAKKDEFLNQYNNKEHEILVSKTHSSDKEIKAISGATITSKAVTEGVNKALIVVKNIKEGK